MNFASSQSCSTCGGELDQPTATLAPGDRIHDKYEVVELLGVGGMGEAYKVRHTALDVFRCIKLIKNSLLDNASAESRFVREARVATRVHHPNVAMVHDFDVAEDGRYYLVSEFIDGITIRQWARRHGRYPADLAVLLITEVLGGLDQIHGKGLLHRDISADNVMLTLDHAGNAMAKIIDLGIAKVVEGPAELSHSTQIGAFVGNPKYASPEQLGVLGEHETIDHRADLYCLSVVFYEMLLGVPPFVSRTPAGYIAKHLTEAPPRFHSIDAAVDLPEGLEDVVFKGLEKDRNKRITSAKEYARSLEPFLAVRPVDSERYGRMIAVDLPSQQTRTLVENWDSGSDATEVTFVPSGRDLDEVSTSDDTVVRAEMRPAIDAVSGTGEWEPPTEGDAWNAAMNLGTAEGWRGFMLAFPSTDRGPVLRWLLGEAEAFERAQAAETRDSWREFLRRFSDGPHATRARERLASLVGEALESEIAAMSSEDGAEEADWNRAADEGTAEAWQQYIDACPDSDRVVEARRRLAEARAFERAMNNPTIESLQAFLQEWRAGGHAKEVRAALESLLRPTEEREAAPRCSNSRPRIRSGIESGESTRVGRLIAVGAVALVVVMILLLVMRYLE